MTSTRRRVRRSWPAALAMATVANLALLSLLAFSGEYRLRFGADASRPVDITLAPWPILSASAPRKAAARASAASARATASPSPEAAAIAPPILAAPPGAGEPSPAVAPDLASALRHGLVGCAHQDLAWMTDADRDACRHRLAAGAASAPYLQGMAPAKLAYYAAVAQAEEDWRSGRDPGHGPGIYCGAKVLPHAIKIGSCYLEPPKGSLDQDVGVPPP